MVKICELTEVQDGSSIQTGNAFVDDDDSDERIPIVQQYGFVSYPPIGSKGVMLDVDGSPEERISFGFMDDKRFSKRQEGETVVYSNHGQHIVMDKDGALEISTKKAKVFIDKDGNVAIECDGKLDVNASKDITVSSQKNVSINGTPKINLNGNDVTVGTNAISPAVLGDRLVSALEAVFLTFQTTPPVLNDGGAAKTAFVYSTWAGLKDSINSKNVKVL